jgi:transposase
MGFAGAERTTRRVVAQAKVAWRAGHRRVFRPWITEPGLWLQWDWGEGPRIKGRRTSLWCAWLAWSRFRVVLPTVDKTMPTVIACLDTTLRRLGGVPTYALTDNEKTVTAEHIARIAVRNPQIVEVGRHYGLTIRSCVPADPQTKGGSEHTVKIAKADLVPTEANLLAAYASFGALETACRVFCDEVNDREHRETRRLAECLGPALIYVGDHEGVAGRSDPGGHGGSHGSQADEGDGLSFDNLAHETDSGVIAPSAIRTHPSGNTKHESGGTD